MKRPKDEIWMAEVGVNGWSVLCKTEREARRKAKEQVRHLYNIRGLYRVKGSYHHYVSISCNGKLVATYWV